MCFGWTKHTERQQNNNTYHGSGIIGDATKGHVFAIDYRLLDPSCEEWLRPRQLVQMGEESAVMELHGIGYHEFICG